MKRSPLVPLSVRIPAILFLHLDALAISLKCSRSELVRDILQRFSTPARLSRP